MDFLSIIGLIAGAVRHHGGRRAEGRRHHALVSAAAFMIVVVGTVAAILLQTPLDGHAARALDLLLGVAPAACDRRSLIAKIVEWSNIRAASRACSGSSRSRARERMNS